jgi:hypothetical protein
MLPMLLFLVGIAAGLARSEETAAQTLAGERSRLMLDGTWDFRMDPKQQGEAERWSSADIPYPHTIPVPGIWQAHGFGEPGYQQFAEGRDWRLRSGMVAKHNYQGVAWFRKTFTAPKEWSGQRVWLRFEGICNHGDVYLNGKKVGRVETFSAPYEFDVTEQIAFDKDNVLACRVDSRNPGADPKSPDAQNPIYYVGMIQFLIPVGGITSHVILEARPEPRIDEVQLTPNLANNTVEVCVKLVRRQAGQSWEGQATIHVRPAKPGGTTTTAAMSVCFAAAATQSETAIANIIIPDLHPWSPEDPFLYLVDTAISDGKQIIDRQTLRTGFRELKATPEGNFVLNGKPYFLRGVGYDSIEPITGVPVPDKKIYAERLRLLKQYGFNYVRFLAHSPHKEFFEAADEEGVFLQTESEWFMGGWADLSEATAQLFTRQIPKMIREFRHHPSWYAFSCFNEATNADTDPGKQLYIRAAYEIFRKTDPTRFFLASEGGGDHWPTDVISDIRMMGNADAPATPPPQQIFQGLLDEVALFGKAISEEAMRTLAEADLDPVAYRRKVVELQPLAYWQLDEEKPGVIHDNSGQRHDGQHAPKINSTALGRPGIFGRAVAGGATPETTPGVSLASQAEKLVTQMQKSFSISLWVKPDAIRISKYSTFFSCGAAERGRALIMDIDGSRGNGYVQLGRCMDNFLRSKQQLRADQWNHVGLTWDGKRVRLFLNGQPDAEMDAAFFLQPRDLALGRAVELTTHTAADYRSRPHVWHEFNCLYTAPLPDLEIEQRLTGVMTQGWVLEPHRRRMESYGLLSRYPELRKLSIRHYHNYVKQAFESARRMPRLDGYAWWVVNDIPAGVECDVTSYGVLDMLYQPEKFTFEEFQKFNGESVLLLDTPIDARVLKRGESRSLKIALSHYGDQPVKNGQLRWKITTGTKTLSESVLKTVNAASGVISELGTIPLGPFNDKQPMKIRVEVELVSSGCQQSNAWEFWVFPERKGDIPPNTLCNLTGELSLDSRYGASAGVSLEDAKVVLARRLTPEILQRLETGGRVILLQEGGEHDQQKKSFLQNPGSLTYWAQGLQCNANVVESHPSLNAFPHEGFSDYQLIRLYGSSTPTVNFTPVKTVARAKVRPIIWSLQLAPWTEEATRFNTALTRHGVLSECRVEKGKVVLCTLYALDCIKRGLPEAGYLLDCLIDYALSNRFEPEVPPFTAKEARKFFKAE